jgi:ankyrin repeat protein
VNLQDKYGQSALIYASFGNYLEVVEYLLKHGASLDLQTKFGQTALFKAAFANSHNIVSSLIAHNANVDLQATDGRTALMIASQANNLKVVEELVERADADVNRQDATGKTAAMLAAENGCFMVVTYMARAGADVGIRDHNGHSLLDMVDKTSGQAQDVTRARLEQAVARGLEQASSGKTEVEETADEVVPVLAA